MNNTSMQIVARLLRVTANFKKLPAKKIKTELDDDMNEIASWLSPILKMKSHHKVRNGNQTIIFEDPNVFGVYVDGCVIYKDNRTDGIGMDFGVLDADTDDDAEIPADFSAKNVADFKAKFRKHINETMRKQKNTKAEDYCKFIIKTLY